MRTGQGSECNKLFPNTGTDGNRLASVQTIIVCLRSQKPEYAFDVLDLSGELGMWRRPIVHAGDRETSRGQHVGKLGSDPICHQRSCNLRASRLRPNGSCLRDISVGLPVVAAVVGRRFAVSLTRSSRRAPPSKHQKGRLPIPIARVIASLGAPVNEQPRRRVRPAWLDRGRYRHHQTSAPLSEAMDLGRLRLR